MKRWIDEAIAIGFTTAVPLQPEKLVPMAAIRDMCAADKCRAFGRNWTCPPFCGTIEECTEKIRGYHSGILLQTVGKMEKVIDTKAYRRTEQLHLEMFHKISDRIRQEEGRQILCLGSGGCRICSSCAYPDSCRFPERACSSMEGYGLFVTQVCKEHGVSYYYGEKTITYTACILMNRKDSENE